MITPAAGNGRMPAEASRATPSGEQGRTRIRLAGRELLLSDVRSRPAEVAPLLARARAEEGNGWCLCRTPPQRLVIRSSRGNGLYHLARWPNTGTLHSRDCSYNTTEDALSGRSGYSSEAIRETDDGVQLRLDAALARCLNLAPDQAPPEHRGRAESRGTVGLLGMLHWVWEEARLNCWNSRWTHRTWATCHAEISRAMVDVTLNGTDADDIAYVVPPYREADAARNALAFARFRTRLSRRGGRQHRGLVLAEIKDVVTTDHGVRYALAHHRGSLFATAALHKRLCASYRPAFSQSLRQVRGRRIGLFLVELTSKGNLRVIDMAAMLVSHLYLPADSSFEVLMADALCTHRRSLVKPIRYDGTQAVFPDFVLTDTEAPTYVEVYGVRGRAEYEARKEAKRTYYRDQGITVIEWVTGRALPRLWR
ncbi:Protein of unknown function [Actinacidiphila alni]|uniref:DUF1173 domain-containing protein n=1 Tax=Actinacidiphila alni TaxID=380248 RepID=A0A1I2LCK5_9ACTN|nr:DUF1173 family protein [Actinacidiphila alni]SFF74806.1 Protein of unknown function [Actinacidiphila alni]